MKRLNYKQSIVAGIFILFLSSCANTVSKKQDVCNINVQGMDGRPCWVNITPKHGIVVNMARNIRPEKTRDALFQKAVVELSAMKGGLGVSQDTVVNKVVRVHNDNMSNKSSVISFAIVTSANEKDYVKAKVKASWVDRRTDKMYMWVVLKEE